MASVTGVSDRPTTQRDVDESIFMLDELANQVQKISDRIYSHLSGAPGGFPPEEDPAPAPGMLPSMNRRLRESGEKLERGIKLLTRVEEVLGIEGDGGGRLLDPPKIEGPSPSRRGR